MHKSARLLALVAGLISSFAAHADVCVSSACGHMETLAAIPDAENTIFTTDVPFFTGSKGLYRLAATEFGRFELFAQPVEGATGNFTGMAQIGQVLYVLGYNGTLYGLQLPSQFHFLTPIQQLTGVAAGNGMVAGPHGELYLVNGPLPTNGTLPDAKIVRVKLDPSDPFHVIEQTTWLAGDALMFPNGLTRSGNTLYLTDHNSAKVAIGSIAAVDILADGSAGALRQIAHFPSIPDDLTLDGTDFIVALYSSGTVARYDHTGKFISQLRPGSIPGASSVKIITDPVLGTSNDLIITQKGVIGINDGDKILIWRHN